MANLDAAFGCRPTKHLNGHPWNGQAMKMWYDGSSSTAVFIGDPVYLIVDACAKGCCPGFRVATAAADDTGYHPWVGAVVGIEPLAMQMSPLTRSYCTKFRLMKLP
ncbi:MAG: hypothetical protein ACWGQW_09375 [bacterium]